jgi:hypothetical protein
MQALVVPEWCAAMRPISVVTDCLLHQPRDLAGPWPHRTHGDPRYPIDLGAPMCPMGMGSLIGR